MAQLDLARADLRLKRIQMRTSKCLATDGGTDTTNSQLLLSTIIDGIYVPSLNYCDSLTAMLTEWSAKGLLSNLTRK